MSNKFIYSSKQFNTRYGKFNFSWDIKYIGIGVSLDLDFKNFHLQLGVFSFTYVAGNFIIKD